jgi:protein involved in polysaccharide export with SLBB domain
METTRRVHRLLPWAALPWCLLAAACRGPAPVPPVAALEPGAPYRIKVGDSLDIRFYKTPELNVEVPVRSDGKISLELIGDVEAAGRQPAELAATLGERFGKELTDPRVSVIVRGFGGSVFVGGEVGTPQAVAYGSGLTVLQAIAAAGGFEDTAHRASVILIRRDASGYHGYRLALTKALSGSDHTQDMRLQPTDIVFVPKSKIANVNLFVEQYIRNLLPVQPALPVF